LKLWLFGNHKPDVRGGDDGIWRRIRVILFNVQISPDNVDRHLSAKLTAELSGFLNWSLEGVRKWLADGLEVPESVAKASGQYRDDEDVLAEFLNEVTVIIPGVRVSRSDLFSAYMAWAERNKVRHPLSQKAVTSRLRDRGLTEARDAHGRYWLGLSIAEDLRRTLP
jgi:putative DNA primase/helicase